MTRRDHNEEKGLDRLVAGRGPYAILRFDRIDQLNESLA